MPLTNERATTPGGRTFGRVVAHGEVTQADAKVFAADYGPGGAGWAVPVLIDLTDPTVSIDSDARQIFSSKDFAARTPGAAIVMTSAPIRVLMTFLVRMTGAKKGQVGLFASQREALAWLDGQPTKSV